MKENDYPYTGTQGWSCKYDESKGVVKAKDFKDVKRDEVDQLVAALNIGPVSVAIEADTYVFQSYGSGVITSKSCGTNLDHGVLAVGYGTDSKYGDYFLVKNSWGSGWGEKGYVRIKRTTGAGICGINKTPSYPIV